MHMNFRSLFFTVLALCSISVFAQDINKLDANGKKNGLWKGTFDESKRPRYEGTFDHGIETGTFKYFNDTKAGSLIATREFSENGTVAYTTILTPKGFKVSEGKTINRINEGLWKYYHEDANDVMATETYKNGKLNGPRKVYFKGNIIAEESNYIDGKLDGTYKKYTEKGIVLEESNYKGGIPIGPATYRDDVGNIAAQGNYVDGAKKGIWKIRDKNNKLVNVKYPLPQVKFKKAAPKKP